jgi:small-conductance mechanosensitive channel
MMNMEWALPIGLVVGGYVGGRILGYLVTSWLARAARTSTWKGDDAIVEALGRSPTLWVSLLGLYAAVVTAPLPASLADLLRKGLLVAFVLSCAGVVGRLAVSYVTLYTNRVRGSLPSTTIFANLTRVSVFVVAALVLLQSLGISVTPILTALGVGGLAVALALQDTLSNLFAGLQIMASGNLKPGDFIQLDSGEEGYVVDVTWRNTTLRELPNNMVVVPNAQLAASRFRNYYQPDRELAVLVQVGVSYDSDLEKVERVTIEVARRVMKEVPGGVPTFEPFIRYHTFGDSSIGFTVVLRGREFADQHVLKHQFVKRLRVRFMEEGIEIPFPILTVLMKQGIEGTRFPLDSQARRTS